jgi:tetratricopeptide (TPR) repeat protein
LARAASAIAVLATSALAAVALAAEPTPDEGSLADARAALDAGDLPAAEEAAERAVSAQPGDGEARLVLGMARFRAGHYAEALDAFDSALHAEHAADAATVEFDRGAVLYKMGRFTDAERAFTAAANGDARLAAVALLDAGLAALDGSDVTRADADARRAAAQPRADEIAGPLGDLRREIAEAEERQARAAARLARTEARQALAAGRTAEAVLRYHDILRDAEATRRPDAERAELLYALATAELGLGRLVDAHAHFAAAAALAPREGEFLFMAGEAALRLDERPEARLRFEEALAAGVDADAAWRARTALDTLAPGLRALGRGVSLDLAAGTGYDTNAAQGDLIAQTEFLGALGGSAFAEASLDVGWHFALGRRAFGELAYGFDQLGYSDAALDPFNLQQHSLTATVEAQLGHWARATMMVGGNYLFAGLEQFGAFQRTLILRPSLSFDEGERAMTTLSLERDGKDILDPAYTYLEGTRTELTLRQDVGRRRARADLAYRYRIEDLPNPEVRLGAMVPGRFGQLVPCDGCQYVIPYSYHSHSALGHVELDLPGDLLLSLNGSVEDRPYSHESLIEPTLLSSGGHPKVRHDWRYGAGAALALGASRQLTLRYDLLVNRSNIDNTRVPLDYDNKNYTKHVISLEASLSLFWARR